jgi:hypothetical protein
MVEAKKSVVSPITIWIGVFPEATSAMAAHDAAPGHIVILIYQKSIIYSVGLIHYFQQFITGYNV